jgi:AraC-like DNA-binding protein
MLMSDMQVPSRDKMPIGSRNGAVAAAALVVGVGWDDLKPSQAADDATEARTKIFALPQSELWFRHREAAAAVPPFDATSFYVKFPSAEAIGVPGGWPGCIEVHGAPIIAGAGVDHVLWRVPKHFLVHKLSVLIGLPITRELLFRPPLDLGARYFDTLSHLLGCVVSKLAMSGGKPNPFVIAELEQAMLVALLCQGDHNMRATLDGVAPRAIPWQVRQVEEYLAKNWREPLDLDLVAQLTGSSVRTIFRLFRQFRGYTPGEFGRRQRMLHARDLLSDRAIAASVAAVAQACGFSDISNFSKEFVRVFGMRPSALRRDRRESP